jgi:hypothetical protein
MDRTALQKHVFRAYIHLRYGMAAIGTAFPIVVYIVGLYDNVQLQNSISAYYWATGSGAFIARTWFVGGLFSLAALLYLYKGFSLGEDLALNIAALFAIGVAVFPMPWHGGPSSAFRGPCWKRWAFHTQICSSLIVALHI